MLGFLPTNANVAPPHIEHRISLMGAVDASMERHAPHVTNPLPPSDQNFEDGMKLYTMNCAVCHGGLDRKPASLAKSFYPPAPNLVSDPPDDPEWHIFYTIRTGIRYTGMPAWEKTLSEQDMWKITSLLVAPGEAPARRSGLLEDELRRYRADRRRGEAETRIESSAEIEMADDCIIKRKLGS
jgi:mono/diheme cytochrome c family protein